MLLLEDNFDSIEVLTETVSEDKPKKLYMKGIMSEADKKNRNGRIYKKSDLKLVADQINDAASKNRHILGETDHPSTLEIKLENVSHRLTEAYMDGNKLMFKAEVIENTPKGSILKALIEAGVQVGVSTRGSGSVNESTGIVENFRFITLDAVGVPSCAASYPETLREQLEMAKNGKIVTDLSEAKHHDPLAQAYFEIEMRKFIEGLSK